MVPDTPADEIPPRKWYQLVEDGCPDCGHETFVVISTRIHEEKPNGTAPPKNVTVTDVHDVYCADCQLNIVSDGEIDCETKHG